MPKKFRSKFNTKSNEKFEITRDDLPLIDENIMCNFEQQINEGGKDTNRELNNREKFIINLVNKVLGGNLEFTEEGYDSLGRSQGYLEEMSKTNAWSSLQDSINELPKDCWMSIPRDIRVGLLKTFAIAISR